MRNKTVLLLLLIFFNSCTEVVPFDVELEKVTSIEFFQTQNFVAGFATENDQFSCFSPVCDPIILDNIAATLIYNDITVALDKLGIRRGYGKSLDTKPQPGQALTLNVDISGNRISAEAVMPDSLTVIDSAFYFTEGDNPGLILFVDTTNLREIEFVEIFATSENSSPLKFKFLLQQNSRAIQDIGFNGIYNRSIGIYFIPESQLMLSGFVIDQGDEFIVYARNLNPESANFMAQYKRTIFQENFNENSQNEGFLFVPPEKLPTNFVTISQVFDQKVSGFFHATYEHQIRSIAF